MLTRARALTANTHHRFDYHPHLLDHLLHLLSTTTTSNTPQHCRNYEPAQGEVQSLQVRGRVKFSLENLGNVY